MQFLRHWLQLQNAIISGDHNILKFIRRRPNETTNQTGHGSGETSESLNGQMNLIGQFDFQEIFNSRMVFRQF